MKRNEIAHLVIVLILMFAVPVSFTSAQPTTDAGLKIPFFGDVNLVLPGWWIVPVAIVILLLAIKSYYIVVPPDQAHVVVYPWGRRAFTSKIMVPKKVTFTEEEVEDEDGNKEIVKVRHEELGDPITYPSAYFRIPIITQRIVLPTTNIPINIKDIVLHDTEVAPFVCDVACWVVIDNPIQAAERIGKIYHEAPRHTGSGDHKVAETQSEIEKDVIKLITAVSRTAAMKVEILELMRDRKKFSNQVEDDTDVSLKKWGLELVDLEVLDIKDADGYSVIVDNEKMVAQEVNTKSRVLVAEKEMEAEVAESDNTRLTRLQVAENDELSQKREVARDQAVDIATQEKNLAVEEATQKANEQKIAAERTVAVGEAEYKADAAIKTAEGEKQSAILTAEGEAEAVKVKADADAEQTTLVGKAEAGIVKAKALAEAEGIDKKADALKKYNEAGIVLEQLKALIEIEKYRFDALGEALSNADVKVLTTGETTIGGIPVGPTTGIRINALLEGINLGPAIADDVRALVTAVKGVDAGSPELEKLVEQVRDLLGLDPETDKSTDDEI